MKPGLSTVLSYGPLLGMAMFATAAAEVMVGDLSVSCAEDPACLNRLHPDIPMVAEADPGQGGRGGVGQGEGQICRRTDPDQGAALAEAILRGLVDGGATLVVTTHYERLKLLATEHAGQFTNAAVGFDIDELRCIYCGLCEEACPEVAAKVQAATAVIETALAGDLIDLVPSYASVLVVYDPMKTDHLSVGHRLRTAVSGLSDSEDRHGRRVVLPVYYAP